MNKRFKLNLSFYTLSDLHFILSSVEKEIHDRLLTHRDLSEVVRAISDHGLTLEDFLPHSNDRPKSLDALELKNNLQLNFKNPTKKSAKYMNPENCLEAWSGFGKTPRWLQAKLNKGSKLSDFLVHKP